MEPDPKRESGFYWVRREAGMAPEVMRYTAKWADWWEFGSEFQLRDSEVDELLGRVADPVEVVSA